VTAPEAALFGEVVVVSIPFGRLKELPVEELAGKIVVDTNNYYPNRDGHFAELDEARTTSSELLQQYLPSSRVVKAFNTQYHHKLREGGRPPGARDRVAVPVAGDDELAKRTVARLIDDIGYDYLDVGLLADGRRIQPGSPVYTQSISRDEMRRRLAA
jgi:predicted dinucleotide-binding enzyme